MSRRERKTFSFYFNYIGRASDLAVVEGHAIPQVSAVATVGIGLSPFDLEPVGLNRVAGGVLVVSTVSVLLENELQPPQSGMDKPTPDRAAFGKAWMKEFPN